MCRPLLFQILMALFLLLFRPECVLASSVSLAQGNKILVATSNQHTYGHSSISAANHFEEIVIADDIF